MFSTSRSSAARPRIPIAAQSLTVNIPLRPKLEAVLKSIKNREEFIEMYALLLSPEDIQRIADAFASVPANSKMTIRVNEIFTNPHSERRGDLILFWDAIKYKVQKVLWNGNKFYKSFLNHLKEDAKNDSNITAINEFSLCDRTDSSHVTPSAAKSPAQKAEQSPVQPSQMQFVFPHNFFIHSPPVAQQRQLSLPVTSELTLKLSG